MKSLNPKFIQRNWILIFLLFLSTKSFSQTYVKVMATQAPKLEIVANQIYTETATSYLLGDNVSIIGGVAPYQYVWKNNGTQIGNSLLLEIPNTTPINSIDFTVVDSNHCSCSRNAGILNAETINTEAFQVLVYPNPAANFVVIEPKGMQNEVQINIIDSKGICVLNDLIFVKTTIDLNLRPGIYMIKIESKDQKIVEFKKIMII